MNNASSPPPPRRLLAHVSNIGLTLLHARNPYVVALWSAMFPGAGHFLLARNLRGYILFILEFFVNAAGHVNMALFYTLLGRFDEAKAVVDLRWSLLYIPIYLFAVWDSYRSAVDLNGHYVIALREGAPVQPFVIKPLGINYIGKCSPYVPSCWCLMIPGLGQLMLHRFMTGAFITAVWFVVIYFSKVLPALHLSFFGRGGEARQILDIQWFLNIPSIYFFCPFAAYTDTVEQNKLFEWEQAKFLRENFQSACFPFPAGCPDERSPCMYILSVFRPAQSVELAVTALEEAGIPKKDIMASAVEKKAQSARFFDAIHDANRTSQFDLPMILGALYALLGCIYGFLLRWGPVLWGIIGGFAGFVTGLLLKLLRYKKHKSARTESEVVIIVACTEQKADTVQKLLQENGALGISHIAGGAVS